MNSGKVQIGKEFAGALVVILPKQGRPISIIGVDGRKAVGIVDQKVLLLGAILLDGPKIGHGVQNPV